jgi:hypothetical protein
MHIHHAVLPEDLANGGEEALVKYWKSLQDLLNQQHPENYRTRTTRPGGLSIIGRRLLSLFLVAFGRQRHPNPCNSRLIRNTRQSISARHGLCRSVDQYLTEIEQELRPPELLTQTWSTFLLQCKYSKLVLLPCTVVHQKKRSQSKG